MDDNTADHVGISSQVCKERQSTWSREFPSINKGTFSISCVRDTPFNVVIRGVDSSGKFVTGYWIALAIRRNCASFLVNVNGKIQRVAKVTEQTQTKAIGYEAGRRITYWLSFDRDNKLLKFGKGYRMKETTLLKADFKKVAATNDVFNHMFFSSDNRKWIDQYDSANFTTNLERRSLDYGTAEVTFDSEPVTTNRSPIVRDSELANMFDIERGCFTFSSDLPLPCQTLYNNVKASHMTIHSAGSPSEKNNLIDAIRRSIESDEGVLHRKLLEKQEKSRGVFNEMYLRVTLGQNFGNSPGIPYVLEIWPKGHGSPIHSHGNAYGVIRVLHGGIRVHIYNNDAMDRNQQPLTSFDAVKGDITWLSPKWFQTHRLWNDTDDFCATLQCYKYGEEDDTHCPYFEYVSKTNEIGQFMPNSDFSFLEMYQLVMAEYQVKTKENNKKKHECTVM
ncbi:hypothetical protein BSL78_23400 [Apostichopus japonicus]|uniref:Cysteine dioxygenase n=1 Tax=Stichopus japonicus TaxID=307972 RepID=A0A2G8JVL4_STIJA|nr:hypothetical protein BSL78_23400 [Apostichopus japonicus]